MKKFQEKIKNFIKKNVYLYMVLKPLFNILRLCFNFILRNRSLLDINNFSKTYKNIFVLDTRIHSIIFDCVVLLIRGSNFFYNDKWSIIIYEDRFVRYSEKDVDREIYFNSLINIFFQTLLILPNPPISIKIIKKSYELIKIINNSHKIFPENYNFFTKKKSYLVRDFNEKDFKNFKINQPILKSTKFYSKIFEDYLDYRDIKKYITITIRNKDWSDEERNTNLEDIKLYYEFIKKNNLKNLDILIIPDTQKDVPKKIINFFERNKLKYHLYHHGSFSIPMRFLAYTGSHFNFCHSNGPSVLLLFIKNNAFNIQKDPSQSNDNDFFIKKFNSEIFKKRKYINFKKLIKKK